MDYEKEVEKLARLSRLTLSETEKKKYASNLASVLQAFDKLDELNLSEAQQKSTPAQTKLRKDEPEAKDFDPFSNAKHKRDRYFVGPRLVE